ncbi:UNVERIFIED_CONTAM: hypothetical protein HDU68_010537 [Siphonaria sp. JEL0065]|nr:hypothetical protein HDU68_010537 [Siphonaria sp. JEL0065]
MLEILVFLIGLYAASRSKPTAAGLRRQLQSEGADEDSADLVGKLTSFLTRVAKPSVNIRTRDGVIAVLAIADDGRAFVGAFNSWVSVPLDIVAWAFPEQLATSQTDPDAESDALIDAAIKRKAARDYADAAQLFSRAAAAATDNSEKARAYTEAAKCYTVLKQREYARQSSCAAAVIYEGMDATGWTRAAALYEKIAGDEKEQGDLLSSISFLDKALELYRNAGDGRAYHIDTQRVEILSLLGRFKDAIPLYESLSGYAITVPTLKFNVRTYLSNSLFCLLALQDQHGLKQNLQKYTDDFPLFSDAEPIWRMLVHAWECGDAEVFENVEKKFRVLNGVTQGTWQDRALGKVAESLHSLC